jgi:hypothetical protein
MSDEFMLPDSTNVIGGRPYNISKRLGRVMKLRGNDDLYHFAAEVDISPRQISRYLAGEPIPPHHLARMAEELDCPGEMLQEAENGGMSG